MDRSTISRYGWIVAVVIIIAILIGISYPGIMFLRDVFVGHVNDLTGRLPDDLGGGGSGGSGGGGVDNPPTLVVINPESADGLNPTIAFTETYVVNGTVEDDVGIQSVSVNGEDAIVNPDGTWTFTIDLVEDVTTMISVVAIDTAGQTATSIKYVCYKDVAAYALVLDNSANSATDTTPMIFVREAVAPTVGSNYESDTYGSLPVLAVYSDVETYDSSTANCADWSGRANNITSVTTEDPVRPVSTAYWFEGFRNCANMNLSKLDMSAVTDAHAMFSLLASAVGTASIDLSYLDVSSVEDIGRMFAGVGYTAGNLTLNLSGWDLSSATTATSIFDRAGYDAGTLNIIAQNWDLSKLTSLNMACNSLGYQADNISLDFSDWNISNVTDLAKMFYNSGATVTTSWSANLSGWTTTSVQTTAEMFFSVGMRNASVEILGFNTWNVSNLEDMHNMFHEFGHGAPSVTLDFTGWNTSKVTNMAHAFDRTGFSSTSFELKGLEAWDTSSVIDMTDMFVLAGYSATYTLDLSEWDVSNVTSYAGFNSLADTKVLAPTWN